MPTEAAGVRHAWHLYILQIDPEVVTGGRDQLIADLTANRIGSSVHFIPLHHHPAFQDLGHEFAGKLERTERYFRQAVSLPLFPSMTDSEVDDVIAVVTASVSAGTN